MIRASFRLFGMVALFCAALSTGALVIGQQMPNGVIAYGGTNPNGFTDLYVLDLVTRMIFNLTRTPNANESNPAWSPDGAHIAYQ